jgi:hypothetical protein
MYVVGEEKLFSDAMSLDEMDSRMIEVSAQYEEMRQAKMERLKQARLAELEDDRNCRGNAFRLLRGQRLR